VQSGMKKALQDISMAPSRAIAELALDTFAEKYGAKYARAVDCLIKDRADLLAFLRSLTDTKLTRDPRFSNPW